MFHSDPWIYLALAVGIIVLPACVIWSIRQHRAPTLCVECQSPIDQLAPSLAGLTPGTAVGGNRVEVLENGAFFDVLLARVAAARQTIHFF